MEENYIKYLESNNVEVYSFSMFKDSDPEKKDAKYVSVFINDKLPDEFTSIKKFDKMIFVSSLINFLYTNFQNYLNYFSLRIDKIFIELYKDEQSGEIYFSYYYIIKTDFDDVLKTDGETSFYDSYSKLLLEYKDIKFFYKSYDFVLELKNESGEFMEMGSLLNKISESVVFRLNSTNLIDTITDYINDMDSSIQNQSFNSTMIRVIDNIQELKNKYKDTSILREKIIHNACYETLFSGIFNLNNLFNYIKNINKCDTNELEEDLEFNHELVETTFPFLEKKDFVTNYKEYYDTEFNSLFDFIFLNEDEDFVDNLKIKEYADIYKEDNKYTI